MKSYFSENNNVSINARTSNEAGHGRLYVCNSKDLHTYTSFLLVLISNKFNKRCYYRRTYSTIYIGLFLHTVLQFM